MYYIRIQARSENLDKKVSNILQYIKLRKIQANRDKLFLELSEVLKMATAIMQIHYHNI